MAAQIKTPSAPSPSADKKKPLAKPRLISSKLAYKGKVFSVVTDKVEEPGGMYQHPRRHSPQRLRRHPRRR